MTCMLYKFVCTNYVLLKIHTLLINEFDKYLSYCMDLEKFSNSKYRAFNKIEYLNLNCY